ncbi:MAG: hypothetical protein MZW92_73170 [Comamonadaceae bacterium]|nr:hypothetical protein [Comamonadaceae bacterium]
MARTCRSGATRSSTTRLEQGRARSPTRRARLKLYQEMQQIEAAEVPEHEDRRTRSVYEAMRKEVPGFKQSPFGSHEFTGVDIAGVITGLSRSGGAYGAPRWRRLSRTQRS